MAGISAVYLPVLLMMAIGIVVVAIALSISKLVTPPRPTREKLSAYECGEEPVGNGRGPVDIQYYLYVLVFLILDIEAVFLIPFALNFVELGTAAIVEMVIFVGLLLAGWAYAINKGALKWQGS